MSDTACQAIREKSHARRRALSTNEKMRFESMEFVFNIVFWKWKLRENESLAGHKLNILLSTGVKMPI